MFRLYIFIEKSQNSCILPINPALPLTDAVFCLLPSEAPSSTRAPGNDSSPRSTVGAAALSGSRAGGQATGPAPGMNLEFLKSFSSRNRPAWELRASCRSDQGLSQRLREGGQDAAAAAHTGALTQAGSLGAMPMSHVRGAAHPARQVVRQVPQPGTDPLAPGVSLRTRH